jgi:hypothetical protein
MLDFLRKLTYLGYYVRETDFRQLRTFYNYSSAITGKSKLFIIRDMIVSVFRYNISLKDYFCFRFFEINSDSREKWAGTGFMYQYQLQMNPLATRDILADKIKFLHHFSPFVRRDFCALADIRNDQGRARMMLEDPSGLIVLKNSRGQVGAEVEVVKCRDFNPLSLSGYMMRKKYDLVEAYIVQHPDLMALSPAGLNTIRIFTQIHDGKVELLGARLRISVNSQVDNMAAGNLAAPVDIETGIVSGPGVYSDITKEDQSVHPVTGAMITGFLVPFWKEVIGLSVNAAMMTPENKSVGWDIAVTPEGPELVEGNHNWCKLLWQMPVRNGLKGMLQKYMK